MLSKKDIVNLRRVDSFVAGLFAFVDKLLSASFVSAIFKAINYFCVLVLKVSFNVELNSICASLALNDLLPILLVLNDATCYLRPNTTVTNCNIDYVVYRLTPLQS